MYFLLPAYADSHARLPKSYGGQGFCLWLNALRVSAVVPQHGTKADMLRRPPARVLCTAGRGFVRGGRQSRPCDQLLGPPQAGSASDGKPAEAYLQHLQPQAKPLPSVRLREAGVTICIGG